MIVPYADYNSSFTSFIITSPVPVSSDNKVIWYIHNSIGHVWFQMCFRNNTKKAKIILMMSVFCSNTFFFASECCKCILRGPDFNFFPETHTFGVRKLPLCLLQSFCHLLKILLKTLEVQYVSGQTPGRLTLKHHYITSTKQKDRQLLARVPFSMQALKMEQSYETNYIN